MTTITLTKPVTYSDGSSSLVTVEVNADGCFVTYLSARIEVPADVMTDMEALAKLFEDAAVRYFIPIVELLGQAYRMKGIVE